MGILTDIFTGKSAKDAAAKTRAFLDQTRSQNEGFIDTGLTTSLANIGQGYGQARGALDTAQPAIDTGYGDALGFLNAGAGNARGQYDASRGYLEQAGGAFDPLSALGTKYGGGTNLYLDSLGVNGAEGNARAGAAFMPSQAYNFNLEQGLEAINRRRNAAGMLASGNADRDAQVFGAGLASNEMKGWQDRLAGLINPELSATGAAATGQAGTLTNLANLGVSQAGMETGLGRDSANLATGRSAMLTDLAKAYAQNYTGEGTALAGLNTGAANARVSNANALAQPYAGTYKQEADAALTGSKNLWGLGMAAAQMAMGMPPTSLGSFGGGNPSSASFGSNPFTPSGNINPAYLSYGG